MLFIHIVVRRADGEVFPFPKYHILTLTGVGSLGRLVLVSGSGVIFYILPLGLLLRGTLQHSRVTFLPVVLSFGQAQ